MTIAERPPQWRVELDAEVEFSNGGALRTEGFRLDIPGSDIDDERLGELLVHHLGLLMVGSVRITRKTYRQEPHKGSRGVEPAGSLRRVVDLGEATLDSPSTGLAGLVDLPGTVVRVLGGPDTVDRSTLAPFDLKGHAVVLHGSGRAHLTPDAAALLVEREAALLATDAAVEPAPLGTIPVITGLRALELLPPNNFRLHAVPFPPGTGTRRAVRTYAVADRD